MFQLKERVRIAILTCMATSNENLFYQLGCRDALAELFMRIRSYGPDAALTGLAKELLTADPQHPHAMWFLEMRKRAEDKRNEQAPDQA